MYIDLPKSLTLGAAYPEANGCIARVSLKIQTPDERQARALAGLVGAAAMLRSLPEGKLLPTLRVGGEYHVNYICDDPKDAEDASKILMATAVAAGFSW